MYRPSKRIVAPLFLFLVTAAIFAPEVRGDGVPMVKITFGDWFFTLPQNPVPDFAGTVDFGFNQQADTFGFIKVPVFTSFSGNTPFWTYDLSFFREPDRTQFVMDCDPFITFSQNPPFSFCDLVLLADIASGTAIWSGPVNNPTFIPGVYGPVTVSEAPEPSTYALLLMSSATLFLLNYGMQNRHRQR